MTAKADVIFIAEAELPTEQGLFRALAFEVQSTREEVLVLVAGTIAETPLVRLHSECLTGDALGSQRCDCGPQLRAAQRQVVAQDGLIVYLRQEGRGIGLLNKIRAYALQDDGMDTVDANLHLGFGADLRDYSVAAAVLQQLGITNVRLLTNNPAKVQGLEENGILVSERVSLIIEATSHNIDYLNTKRQRMQHQLPHMNGKTVIMNQLSIR